MADQAIGSHLFAASSLAIFLLLANIHFLSAQNPWTAFYNLSGCHLGDSRTGIAEVKRYFYRLGYLSNISVNCSDEFDANLRSAIVSYQQYFHLNTTGELDPSTIDFMVRPRCGVPDINNGSDNMNVHGRGLFVTRGIPWQKRTLTYAFFQSGIPTQTRVLRRVLTRAFRRWSRVTTLSFVRVSRISQADIKIGFFSREHGDGAPFDGPLGVLAHAFFPQDGRFHYDADEQWVVIPRSGIPPIEGTVFDLETVAIHEIGHVLGLDHSTTSVDNVMFPFINSGQRKVSLAPDDIQGIQSLYG